MTRNFWVSGSRGMAEKRVGDSSDSDVYMSADEGLGSSRGSENRHKVDSEPEKAKGTHSSDAREREGKSEPESGGREGEKSGDDRQPVAVVDGLSEREAGLQESGKTTEKSATEPRESDETNEKKTSEKDESGEKERGGGEVKQVELEEGEERTPIPPPRRKRKKKLQKNPSLEDLEKSLGEVRIQRSMTVGSVDMARERLISSPAITSLSPSRSQSTAAVETPGNKPLGSPSGVRGVEISPPSSGATVPDGKATPDEEVDSRRHSRGHPGVKNAPSISIEPDTSLELTEEMMLGQSEVMTRDTPLAKAYGSDKHETEIIFDSDDESEGDGVYGSQELPLLVDQSDYGPADARDPGQSSEVVGEGRERSESGKSEGDHKEKTPVAEEEEEGERAHSPSDNQILQMTIVKNLDTGDSFPLSVVNEKIPLGNPLNQHLYRRTAAMESHGEEGSGEEAHHRRRQIRKKLRHFWGKKKTKAHGDGMARGREGGEAVSRGSMSGTQDHDTTIKYKPSSHHKGPYEFDRVRLRQDLTGPHLGAVWVMEFSICGRLLAVAGQDSIVRVWVLRSVAQFFHELQAKYQRFGVHSSGESLAEKASVASTTSSEEDDANSTKGPFLELPICSYHGHSADVLDLSWSKNFFLLSSSMDKTVRLWHISRKECLCCFQHVDFVTAIAFHPRDDRYFLSGSLDGKLRLWNIPDKRVALWNEIEGVGSHLITAANFCMNGKLAVAGTYDGRCIFYETEHLKYHTQIHVKSRHGKNRGRKVSGIEPLPGEEKILVTTNDSRLRLYNLKDHSLSCKYKGGLNTSSQIRATFSRDGLSIISGSEDHFIYVWKTHHDVNKLSSVRRDRNEFYESFTTHHAPVTAAVFAPVPGITVDQGLKEVGQMIIAADYQGGIKVYVNSEHL